MTSESDEQIAKQVQSGDIEAFGVLVDRYEQKITRYGHKFLADREDIRDLVQRVFIKAYTNMKSFDATKSFSPWIYRIAHNEFVNQIKFKSRQLFLSIDFDAVFPQPVAQETADGKILNDQLRLEMDRFLSKLDPKYREPLALHYFQELSYEEISEILRVPVSTVGVRLRRGREQLKALYEKHNRA